MRSFLLSGALLLLALTSLSPVRAVAAEPQGPTVGRAGWSRLGQLEVGQRIEVEIEGAIQRSGTFLAYSEETLRVREDSREVSYRRSEVLRVSVLKPSRRGRNAVIGVLAGFGVGAGVAAAADASGRDFAHPVGVGAVGAAIGGLLGALLSRPSQTVVYRRAP